MTLPLFVSWLAAPFSGNEESYARIPSSQQGTDNRAVVAGNVPDSRALNADHALMQAVRASDPHGLEQIFRLYAPRLLHFATKQLRSSDIAEDIVQDVFLSIWRIRETWDVRTSLATYLFQAVRHRIAAKRTTRVGEDPRGDAVQIESISLTTSAQGPDDAVTDAELQTLVEQTVHKLSPKTQEVFRLSRDYGLSYRDIASLLGISVKTVEMHVGRALRALRNALAEWRS